MSLKIVYAAVFPFGMRLPLHGPLVILEGTAKDIENASAQLGETASLSFAEDDPDFEDLPDYGDDTANALADAMASLEGLPGSRERSMVRTKLDEAMMWLHRAIPPTNEAERD